MYFSAIHFSLAFCGSKVVLNFLEAWLRKVMLLITSDLLQPDSRVRRLDHIHAERAPAKARPTLTPGMAESPLSPPPTTVGSRSHNG